MDSWLVVWNIFYFPFHIWDNPSHWLIFFRWVGLNHQPDRVVHIRNPRKEDLLDALDQETEPMSARPTGKSRSALLGQSLPWFWKGKRNTRKFGLWQLNVASFHMIIYSWLTYYTWWFSIANCKRLPGRLAMQWQLANGSDLTGHGGCQKFLMFRGKNRAIVIIQYDFVRPSLTLVL